jgi:hypothetical protein
VNRVWQALIIGGVFVGIVEVLGYRHMATPMWKTTKPTATFEAQQ